MNQSLCKNVAFPRQLLSIIVPFLSVVCGLSQPIHAQSLSTPIRSSRVAVLRITQTTQQLTLLKRDLNIYSGADILQYEVKDVSGTVLHKGQIVDDGNSRKGGGRGRVQSKSISLKLKLGYYTFHVANNGSDLHF